MIMEWIVFAMVDSAQAQLSNKTNMLDPAAQQGGTATEEDKVRKQRERRQNKTGTVLSKDENMARDSRAPSGDKSNEDISGQSSP
ncbi:MAG TPA: hypothetical protein PKC28_03575 [Bdellovibrionales bacterium]|nr:hypothetical protein [Bdellovibrionales bacterium]